MSSARPSLGKLDAHLSFVPDDDEDEAVSPEPEPERSVADTKAEEKRITDIISEAMDLNMMDMEVKFAAYASNFAVVLETLTEIPSMGDSGGRRTRQSNRIQELEHASNEHTRIEVKTRCDEYDDIKRI